MNRCHEPYASLDEYHEEIDYGKHSSGRVKCSPIAHEARHQAIGVDA
ncbi:hypothetical protein [Mycobacteroides abscessus]|nr:hypothetical protein [Mycobacteroides abscessus]